MDKKKEEELDQDNTASVIYCIGVDRKQHVCLPDAQTTKCGVKILRKKLLKNDFKLFSCYPCTY